MPVTLREFQSHMERCVSTFVGEWIKGQILHGVERYPDNFPSLSEWTEHYNTWFEHPWVGDPDQSDG